MKFTKKLCGLGITTLFCLSLFANQGTEEVRLVEQPEQLQHLNQWQPLPVSPIGKVLKKTGYKTHLFMTFFLGSLCLSATAAGTYTMPSVHKLTCLMGGLGLTACSLNLNGLLLDAKEKDASDYGLTLRGSTDKYTILGGILSAPLFLYGLSKLK